MIWQPLSSQQVTPRFTISGVGLNGMRTSFVGFSNRVAALHLRWGKFWKFRSKGPERDFCRWTLTGNGNFSSASAWQLASNTSANPQLISLFWSEPLTPSMSIFLWRLVANCIPVDAKLQWRMVQMASKCRWCKTPAVETTQHLFIESEAAMRLWAFFGKWFIHAPGIQGVGSTITQKLQQWRSAFPGATSLLHVSSVIPSLIMWYLWLERNECTFSGTPFRIGHIIWRVNLQIARLIQGGILTTKHWKGISFQHPLLVGRPSKRRVTRATKVTWCPPLDNWIKVNTDGAFSPTKNMAGGGGALMQSGRQDDLGLQYFLPCIIKSWGRT